MRVLAAPKKYLNELRERGTQFAVEAWQGPDWKAGATSGIRCCRVDSHLPAHSVAVPPTGSTFRSAEQLTLFVHPFIGDS